MPTVADVLRDPLAGSVRQLPWEAPMYDAGVNGAKFVPGRLNYSYDFWEKVVLRDHPQKAELLSYLKDGVSVFEFLTEPYRGTSRKAPYRQDAFPGGSYPNRIAKEHAGFARSEVTALVKRGCLVKWADVRGPTGPKRPRLVLALSVEPSKSRLVIDARPLNETCRHVKLGMDTVARVAVVAEKIIFMGSLDDRSGFHNLGLQPESWPLFGVSYEGTDLVCTTVPFGWNESPACYHALSEAKAAYRRSRGIPVLAYIDDAWYGNFSSTFGRSDKAQWLSAAEALHVGMLVSYFCGYFLSDTKCDLKPSRVQRYLGILCDSSTTSFRIPEDKLRKLRKLRKLHALISAVLANGTVTVPMMEKIARKCVSMSVAIRPASLWTHFMFAAIAKAEGRTIQLGSKPDLCAELKIWLSLLSTSQKGPWYKARHFASQATVAASDASSNQWGGVVSMPWGELSAGGGFPHEWLPRHINGKEMFALLEVLSECCRRHPGELRRVQLVMDVDNRSMVDAFKKGRSRNPITHAMLIKLFELQVTEGFWLSLRWVPTADNTSADAITRPGRDEIIRLRPATFRQLRVFFGEFTVDLLASSENAQLGPATVTGEQRRLPFYSRYHCEGSAGVDVFRQNVAVTPGGQTTAFGYCFPPPVMVGHVVQHMAECGAHAVIVIPDVRDHWFPRVHRATVRSLAIPKIGSFGFPHHRDGVRDYVYVQYGMRAVEVDFPNA